MGLSCSNDHCGCDREETEAGSLADENISETEFADGGTSGISNTPQCREISSKIPQHRQAPDTARSSSEEQQRLHTLQDAEVLNQDAAPLEPAESSTQTPIDSELASRYATPPPKESTEVVTWYQSNSDSSSQTSSDHSEPRSNQRDNTPEHAPFTSEEQEASPAAKALFTGGPTAEEIKASQTEPGASVECPVSKLEPAGNTAIALSPNHAKVNAAIFEPSTRSCALPSTGFLGEIQEAGWFPGSMKLSIDCMNTILDEVPASTPEGPASTDAPTTKVVELAVAQFSAEELLLHAASPAQIRKVFVEMVSAGTSPNTAAEITSRLSRAEQLDTSQQILAFGDRQVSVADSRSRSVATLKMTDQGAYALKEEGYTLQNELEQLEDQRAAHTSAQELLLCEASEICVEIISDETDPNTAAGII